VLKNGTGTGYFLSSSVSPLTIISQCPIHTSPSPTPYYITLPIDSVVKSDTQKLYLRLSAAQTFDGQSTDKAAQQLLA